MKNTNTRKISFFMISSFLAFCIDYTCFNLIYYFIGYAVIATIIARIISASINFIINKKYVFKATNQSYNFKNYVILAICILCINCIFIYLFVDLLLIPAYIAKIVVELTLYFLSYFVQNYLANKY